MEIVCIHFMAYLRPKSIESFLPLREKVRLRNNVPTKTNFRQWVITFLHSIGCNNTHEDIQQPWSRTGILIVHRTEPTDKIQKTLWVPTHTLPSEVVRASWCLLSKIVLRKLMFSFKGSILEFLDLKHCNKEVSQKGQESFHQHQWWSSLSSLPFSAPLLRLPL